MFERALLAFGVLTVGILLLALAGIALGVWLIAVPLEFAFDCGAWLWRFARNLRKAWA